MRKSRTKFRKSSSRKRRSRRVPKTSKRRSMLNRRRTSKYKMDSSRPYEMNENDNEVTLLQAALDACKIALKDSRKYAIEAHIAYQSAEDKIKNLVRLIPDNPTSRAEIARLFS